MLAIGFIMGAIFSALRQADVGPAMSSLVCGAICIAVAAALVWTGRSMVK